MPDYRQAEPVFDADGWPGNGPAWHSLTDGQVLRAGRALAAPGGDMEPGRRRWRMYAVRWQVAHRLEAERAS